MKEHQNLNIVFFDGVCSLCNYSVDFIVKNNSKKTLFIASLQGKTAKELLTSEHRKSMESLIFYEKGQVYERSTAALEIARHLKFPYNLLSVFSYLPKSLRDFLYNLIAKNRYKWFGQKQTCRIPTESEKKYFLE